jgi:hypothetical protein
MNAAIDLSTSTYGYQDCAIVRIDVCAIEPSPVYPAMFAAAIFDPRDTGRPGVRVVAQPDHRGLLASIERASCTLAAMSASHAARAILEGLPAKIVCAAVAPADYSAIAGEPLVPWATVGSRVIELPPRAVLVAPNQHLDQDPECVRAAIDAYWQGALHAIREPAMLSVVLATELGLSPAAAEREARRSLAAWRLEPAVRAEGLEGVLATLGGSLAARAARPEWLLDERFVRADWLWRGKAK